MYLFITEWKKIWKKNLGVSFLIITVIVSAVFFILNYQQKNPSQALYESHVLTTSQHENQAHNWRPTYFIETGEYEEIDEEMINDMLGMIIDPLRYLGLGFVNTNVGIDPHPPTGDNWNVESNTLTLATAQLRYLRDNEIEPRQPLRVQQSQRDRDRAYQYSENLIGESKEQARLFANHHESQFNKGWYTVWQLIIDQAYFILLALIILVFGGILAIERTKKRAHIHLLVTEGVKKPYLYITKLLVSWSSGVLFFLTSMGTFLLTSLFFLGTGTLKYPVMFHFFEEESHVFDMPNYFLHPHLNTSNNTFSLTSISLGRYLFQAFTIIVLIMLFILAICFIVSLIIRSELVVSIAGLAVIGLHFFLPTHINNPLSYFSVHQIVSGEIRLIYENNLMSFERAVAVLGIWSIVFIIAGCLIYSINWQKMKGRSGER